MNGFRLSPLAVALSLFCAAVAAEEPAPNLLSPTLRVPLSTGVKVDVTSMALNNNGTYVSVGTRVGAKGNANIVFQRYDQQGRKLGDEQKVAAGTGSRGGAEIAMEPDGEFVIAWSNVVGNPGYGIYARQYTADGVAKGPAFPVSPTGRAPQVGVGPAGNFAVAWYEFAAIGNPVYVRSFNSNGTPHTDALKANALNVAHAAFDVAMGADGDFAVAFEGEGAPGNPAVGPGIFLRRFHADGTAVSEQEKLVSPQDGAAPRAPALASTYDGQLMVAWSVAPASPGANTAVYGRCYKPNGDAFGPSVQISQYAFGQRRAVAVDAEDSRKYLVAWEAEGQSPRGIGIVGRRVRQTCEPDSGEFLVSPVRGYAQTAPMVVETTSGAGMIGWLEDGHPAEGQLYSPHANGRTTVSFEDATEDVEEGGLRNVGVRLSQALDHDVSFKLQIGGSANASTDPVGAADFKISGDGIVPLPGERLWQWTIPAGTTRAVLTYKSFKDEEDDPGEYSLLKIDTSESTELAPGPGATHAIGIF